MTTVSERWQKATLVSVGGRVRLPDGNTLMGGEAIMVLLGEIARLESDAEALARAVSASQTHPLDERKYANRDDIDRPLVAALSAYLEKHPWSDL